MTSVTQEITGTLITIGDEILFGSIPNGNARYIAIELRSRGFLLSGMVVVGDEEDQIVPVLKRGMGMSHFVIVTGGLGPTDDDLTSSAVARALERPLAPDPGYVDWLKRRMAERGREWSREVARMADLPRGARKIGLGMAGYALEHGGVPCYFLPGVPSEMRWLMEHEVIPDLESRFPNRRRHVKHVLRFHGLAESSMNRKLRDLEDLFPGVRIGYLPQIEENWITVLASGEDEADARGQAFRAEEAVVERLGAAHLIGRGDDGLASAVGKLLRARAWRIGVAESCTGGLLSREITAVSGASDYFDRGLITYSNASKTELLGVGRGLIEDHGAVSEPVARAMAEGARREAGVEVALSITGIAGPNGGSPEKPVGTVFIGCSTPAGTVVEQHRFNGDREHIRECAAQAALALLWRLMTHDSQLRRPGHPPEDPGSPLGSHG
ncbi:MAG: CinA family nicotinamide mononucleotide deamidase-related protein [Syntrophobacteraceae bacterium]|jgi:nicotinamide-nucleotide amidase|nr:CinA family nicotinamide mononucleotide deamidase-related protein [Syntrophobacteraceae bacterium]